MSQYDGSIHQKDTEARPLLVFVISCFKKKWEGEKKVRKEF